MRRRSSSSSRTAHKSYRIYLPPQVLLLHLKRFQHDGRGRLNKLDTAVKFEFELDLSPFLARNAPTGTGEAGAVQQGTGNGDAAVGSSEQQPQQQQQPQEQQQQQSLMYDLVGLVVHMGTMRGGHYIGYVKRVHGDATEQGPAASSSSSAGKAGGRMQWYYISDTTVRAVGVSEVAAAQAYMLLYARRPVEVAQQQGSQQLFEHDCGL
jgi:ubiquitin carboxyl-terminal hydrolase 16/45